MPHDYHRLECKLDHLVAWIESELGSAVAPHAGQPGGNMRHAMDDLARRVESLDVAIRGCSKVTGIMTRIDRLEQSEERRKWTVRAIGGAVIGILVKMAAAALSVTPTTKTP